MLKIFTAVNIDYVFFTQYNKEKYFPKPQMRISHHLTLELNIKIDDTVRSGIKMILKFPINTVTLSLPRSH